MQELARAHQHLIPTLSFLSCACRPSKFPGGFLAQSARRDGWALSHKFITTSALKSNLSFLNGQEARKHSKSKEFPSLCCLVFEEADGWHLYEAKVRQIRISRALCHLSPCQSTSAASGHLPNSG
eukprot:164846-Pelagomonas_calceolata.AAC.3